MVKSLDLNQLLEGVENLVLILQEPSILLNKHDDPYEAEFPSQQMKALCQAITERGFHIQLMTPYASEFGEASASLDQILEGEWLNEGFYGDTWYMEEFYVGHAATVAPDFNLQFNE